MTWNNQPALPYSATGPEHAPMNLTLNNPPYVPGDYQGPPIMQQILPLVCGALAIEVQQRAQSNPLRTFMYNQYSRNSFNNEDFHALVHATMEYIVLEMNANRYGNVEQAAQNCVPQMAEMLCAINLRVFTDLEAYVNQNVVQTLRNTIANFDRIATQIKNARSGGMAVSNNQGSGSWGNNNQGGGWGQQTSWGGQQQQGGWGSGQAGASATGAGVQNRWQSGGGTQGNWGNQPKASTGTGTSGLFNGSDRRSGTSGAAGSNVGGKWGNENPLKQPYEARQPKEEPMNTQPQQEEVQAVEASLASGKIKWRPSNTHPYLPASAPSTGEIWLRQHPNGQVEAFLKEKEEGSVDYDKHATGNIFGPPPRTLDLTNAAQTMAKIEEGIRKVNNVASMSEAERKAPEVSTIVHQVLNIETSLDSAWLTGSLKRLTAPSGQVANVFRTYARIANPIVTKTDHTAALANFGASKTYIELREKLQVAIDEKSAPALWGEANAKMTVVINRILNQKLALPDLSIDSFIIDIEELISYLGKQFGQNVQQAFLKNQKSEIHAAFLTLDEKNATTVTENHIGDMKFEDDNKPAITYMVSDYTLTYLDCLSYELDIDLTKHLGTLVTDTLTPILHSMLSGLFAEVEEHGDTFERHLVITNDGRVLEAARGYLGDKAFMLTLVK